MLEIPLKIYESTPAQTTSNIWDKRIKFPRAPAASVERGGPPCEQSASYVAQSSKYPAMTERGTSTSHLLITGCKKIETKEYDQRNLVPKFPSYEIMPRPSLHIIIIISTTEAAATVVGKWKHLITITIEEHVHLRVSPPHPIPLSWESHGRSIKSAASWTLMLHPD